MNAQEIIDEIDNYLDKALLKTSKITNQELIDFIEEKWEKADDEKYSLPMSDIICGRMINEYAALKDVENVRRWLEMFLQHERSKSNPEYIRNYFRGECYLKCGAEEEALKYLRLCYEDDPEYIFTRGKGCIDLFCKHTGIKSPKEKARTKKEYFEDYVCLPVWEEFFGEEAKEIFYNVGGDDPEYRLSKIHKKGLKYIIDNQDAILSVLLNELNNQYADLQNEYDYDDEEKADFMPDVTKISDFSDLLSPIAIHILSVHKDGMPYIGYEFSCSWDKEHALGFMMLKDNIVEMGGADCSFLTWIAENHLKGDNE